MISDVQERQREQVGDDQQPANLRLARHQVRAEPLVQRTPAHSTTRHHEDACRGARIEHHPIVLRRPSSNWIARSSSAAWTRHSAADQPDDVSSRRCSPSHTMLTPARVNAATNAAVLAEACGAGWTVQYTAISAQATARMSSLALTSATATSGGSQD